MHTAITYAISVVLVVGIIWGIIVSPHGVKATEGEKRAGRIGLWLMFPPLGFWRSVRHGRIEHEDRLAKKIAEELKRR
jgi:hypothetical protein